MVLVRRTSASKPPPVAPDDLAAAFKKNAKARATFDGFSPSQQREYVDWITEAKRDITRLEVTGSMHERKARMAELSDAFLALPGGIGTFEEAFETMTWTQLGVHDKPIALVDVDGFYAPAAALLDRAVEEDFLGADVRASIVVAPTTPAALDAFGTWERPALGKWTEVDGPMGVDET